MNMENEGPYDVAIAYHEAHRALNSWDDDRNSHAIYCETVLNLAPGMPPRMQVDAACSVVRLSDGNDDYQVQALAFLRTGILGVAKENPYGAISLIKDLADGSTPALKSWAAAELKNSNQFLVQADRIPAVHRLLERYGWAPDQSSAVATIVQQDNYAVSAWQGISINPRYDYRVKELLLP